MVLSNTKYFLSEGAIQSCFKMEKRKNDPAKNKSNDQKEFREI